MKTINPNIIKTMGLVFTILSLSSFMNFKTTDKGLAIIEGRVLNKGLSINGANIDLTRNDSVIYNTKAGMLGYYKIDNINSGKYKLKVQAYGYIPEITQDIYIEPNAKLIKNIDLKPKPVESSVDVDKKEDLIELAEEVEFQHDALAIPHDSNIGKVKQLGIVRNNKRMASCSGAYSAYRQDDYLSSTESYTKINENKFFDANKESTSTFSIDVDKASYSNIRRFLTYNSYPKADAVRVEEMINYFNYDYTEPTDKHPFAVHSTVAPSPWNKKIHLMKIGIKGKETFNEKNKALPPSNLVFLIDVSGSMSSANKLPLLKQSFSELVDQLRQDDKVSIVVYAGAAGLVLPPTSGADKQKIKDALNKLSAGGSTAGGAGIKLAYNTAKDNLVKGGNNRVILATDGDFNIGISNLKDLEKLITEKRSTGIYLTTIGLGMGNYKDDRMEMLADKGNGNYFYIDNINEAKKVFVEEFTGTIYTIAKDVKIQVEFNDQYVKRYRLIGYENRKLENKDFADDKKDAGELGMGHTVTAIYEVEFFNEPNNRDQSFSEIRLRYKKPDEEKSQLMTHNIKSFYKDLSSADKDFKLACSVAAFGMKLRASKHLNGFSYDKILALAKESKKEGDKYRDELISLIEKARILSPEFSSASK